MTFVLLEVRALFWKVQPPKIEDISSSRKMRGRIFWMLLMLVL